MVPVKDSRATTMQIVTEHFLQDVAGAYAKLVGKETGKAVLVTLIY